jgi:hypothetical protein
MRYIDDLALVIRHPKHLNQFLNSDLQWGPLSSAWKYDSAYLAQYLHGPNVVYADAEDVGGEVLLYDTDTKKLYRLVEVKQ